MRIHLFKLVGVLALVACTKEEHGAADTRHDVDNTANNRGDEKPQAVTPTDQQENARDLELTRKIRQGIVESEALSFTAKNTKVMAVDGIVTLRGPVDTDKERTLIGSLAQQIAGTDSVRNQLEVKN